MKLDLSIETIAAALAALKIGAISLEARKVKATKFRQAYAQLQAEAHAVLQERMLAEGDDLLKLNSIHH
jgi:hypothetical protein